MDIIIISGRNRADNAETKVILFDAENKEFGEVKIDPGMHVVDRLHFVFADFNGDGIIDIVAAEAGDNRSSGIYLGNGDGTFARVEMTFSDPSYMFLLSSVDVADFNNDGYMDFFVAGNLDNGTSNANNGAHVLANVFLNAGADDPGQFPRMDLGNLETGVLKQIPSC